MAYSIVMAWRVRAQTAYRPEFEDWLFYVVLPIAAYTLLGITACAARSHVGVALFGVGAAALLLLFTGIHNAWDAATYHIFVRKPGQPESGPRPSEQV